MSSIWDKTINKSIPTPLYFQIEQILREGINSGELSPGDMIPTEKELTKKYDVSRATIRQAILNLVNENYLRREKSKGTFVIKPPERLHFSESLRWFSEYLNRTGVPFSTKIIMHEIINPDQEVKKLLKLNSDENIYYVKRLRYLDGSPYILDEHFVPYKLCVGIEKVYNEDLSLYNTLINQFGIDLHHGWREFEPVLPTSEEAEYLEIFQTSPILVVHSRVSNQKGLPVDYFIAKIRGKFSVDITLDQKVIK